MEFIIIAYDYKDDKALERRFNVRDKHLEGAAKLHADGKLIFASALLDENGNMTGSVMAVNFTTENELKIEWLDNEPYITGKVWEKVIIKRAKFAKH